MPRPREFKPDQVLDSAMRQFWERGYRATSVDDLVRATGVKPGSLYSAFPGGKHALLMGSLERYSRLVVPQKLGDLPTGALMYAVDRRVDGCPVLVVVYGTAALDNPNPAAPSGAEKVAPAKHEDAPSNRR